MSERTFPIHNGKLMTDLDANGHKIKGLVVEIDSHDVEEIAGRVVAEKMNKSFHKVGADGQLVNRAYNTVSSEPNIRTLQIILEGSQGSVLASGDDIWSGYDDNGMLRVFARFPSLPGIIVKDNGTYYDHPPTEDPIYEDSIYFDVNDGPLNQGSHFELLQNIHFVVPEPSSQDVYIDGSYGVYGKITLTLTAPNGATKSYPNVSIDGGGPLYSSYGGQHSFYFTCSDLITPDGKNTTLSGFMSYDTIPKVGASYNLQSGDLYDISSNIADMSAYTASVVFTELHADPATVYVMGYFLENAPFIGLRMPDGTYVKDTNGGGYTGYTFLLELLGVGTGKISIGYVSLLEPYTLSFPANYGTANPGNPHIQIYSPYLSDFPWEPFTCKWLGDVGTIHVAMADGLNMSCFANLRSFDSWKVVAPPSDEQRELSLYINPAVSGDINLESGTDTIVPSGVIPVERNKPTVVELCDVQPGVLFVKTYK